MLSSSRTYLFDTCIYNCGNLLWNTINRLGLIALRCLGIQDGHLNDHRFGNSFTNSQGKSRIQIAMGQQLEFRNSKLYKLEDLVILIYIRCATQSPTQQELTNQKRNFPVDLWSPGDEASATLAVPDTRFHFSSVTSLYLSSFSLVSSKPSAMRNQTQLLPLVRAGLGSLNSFRCALGAC